jgi:hypothetical protein
MCNDGIDNDCDGLIDGADPDCQTCMPTEDPEATCNDGVDNDCDGLTDGDDPDCGAPVDCSQIEDRRSCRAEATCRWDNKNKLCVEN